MLRWSRLHLGYHDLQHLSFLIFYISSDTKVTYIPITEQSTNQGGTRLVAREDMTEDLVKFISGDPIESKTIGDLISASQSKEFIIKIDVEVIHTSKFSDTPCTFKLQGYECKVLTNYFSNPKPDVFIPYVFMEWYHIRHHTYGACPDLGSLVKLFVERGYRAWNIDNNSYLDPEGIITCHA